MPASLGIFCLSAADRGVTQAVRRVGARVAGVAGGLIGREFGSRRARLLAAIGTATCRCCRVCLTAGTPARWRGRAWRWWWPGSAGPGHRIGAARRMPGMPDVPLRPDPFLPQAAPGALEDLRARLRATRWPDAPEDAGWSLGTDLAYLRELVAYWADGFDWPAQEAALARLPRFRVAVGGLGIHFVHARATGPAGPVLPLVLCHGWP